MKTDAQGRFQRELTEAPYFARVFAKFIDLTLAGAMYLLASLWLPPLESTTIGTGWFLLSDWLGSPGKWLLRLEAVSLDGRRVGPLRSALRNLFLMLPLLGRAVLKSGWWGSDRDAMYLDLGVLACLGLVMALVELVTMAILPLGQRWSDTMAKSRVVRR